jgi:hypothetical protein
VDLSILKYRAEAIFTATVALRTKTMPYAEIIEGFPAELRFPVARLVDELRQELGIQRVDFEELKAIVRDLAGAQKRTEERVEELAYAQKQTQDELVLFRRTFTTQIGGLGARWGLQTEEAFRQAIEAILREVGFSTERFLENDVAGEVFGYPEQIELDVVIKNGKVIVIEIKAAAGKSDVYYFDRKVAFYARKTGREVNRKLMVTPYADNRARETGVRLGVEICTDITALG